MYVQHDKFCRHKDSVGTRRYRIYNFISEEFSLHYSTIDDAMALQGRFYRGALMSKLDYRRPSGHRSGKLLGMCLRDRYYVDTYMPTLRPVFCPKYIHVSSMTSCKCAPLDPRAQLWSRLHMYLMYLRLCQELSMPVAIEMSAAWVSCWTPP